MAKTATQNRKEWTKENLNNLKTWSKNKTPVKTIASRMRRTPGAVRQKAHALGLSMDTRSTARRKTPKTKAGRSR